MKNRIVKIKISGLIIGALLLVNSGCVDLEETPKDFARPANFYSSATQIESAFVSAMSRLYSEWESYSYGHGIFQRRSDVRRKSRFF